MPSDAPIAPLAEPEHDILCPLCEYNLRGLTEPRCPECGHRSTWEELRNRPPLHPYLFEHHPKHNTWSFFRTLFGSLRPVKFWRSVKPAMPLRTGRLLVFGTICLFIGLIASGFGIFGSVAQQAQTNALRRQGVMREIAPLLNPRSPVYDPRLAARVQETIQKYGSLQAALLRQYPPLTSTIFWENIWQTGFTNSRNQPAIYPAAVLVLCWVPLTFLSLLIFRISMRRARIRTGHVLRCVLYTAAPISFYGLFLIAATFIILNYARTNNSYAVIGYEDATYQAGACFLLLLAIRLMFAYRLYLRFHLAIATVIASQIIVALSLLEINMFLLHH